jgi:hypothetical protein
MIVEEEIEILIRYGEADTNRRLHFFLEFPDLRSGFQEIERKDLTAQIASRSLCGRRNRGKRSYLSTLLSRIMEIRVLKNVNKFLRPYDYGDVVTGTSSSYLNNLRCAPSKRRLGRRVPALITIIPFGDFNESTIFKSEIANKSIWP